MSGLIGQTIGSYEITALIGRGGSAEVYHAQEVGSRRQAALKVITLAHNTTPSDIKRFWREAETIVRLNHPHVIDVYDFGQQGSFLYLAMQLLTGGSLADVIEHGPMPLDDIARIFAQVTSALSYVHHAGIIHRDLKPHNILMDQAGVAYLADFGLVKTLNATETHLTTTGIMMGTPSYTAPEQWLDAGAIDVRTDIYALGIMLFEMLTGRVPFDGETHLVLMQKHIYEPPPSILRARPDLPPALEYVVEKALAKDPGQRYTSAADLLRAFQDRLAQQETLLRVVETMQLAPSSTIPPARQEGTIKLPAEALGKAPDAREGRTYAHTTQQKEPTDRRFVAQAGFSMRAAVDGLIYGIAWTVVQTLFVLALSNLQGAGFALSGATAGDLALTALTALLIVALPIRVLARFRATTSRLGLLIGLVCFFAPALVLMTVLRNVLF